MRRVTRLFLLSAGLFVIVGLTRYFQGVWQQAPSTANPFDTTWLIIILIALVTGTIILGLFSLFTPAAFRVISRMLGVPEDVKPEVSVNNSSSSPTGSAPDPRAAPSATGENIAELIARVDKEFSQRKLPTARPWAYAVVGVFGLIEAGVLVLTDLSVRIAIIVGGAAVLIPLVQIILDHYDSWVTHDNYQRLLKGEKENLLLYALVLMKTAAPDLRLAEAYELNRGFFDPLALTASVYKLTSSR